MSANNRSSRNIRKLIRIVDEVAFQANLLALGAAVERASTGADRLAFRSVADEVRELARRGALAAMPCPLAEHERTT